MTARMTALAVAMMLSVQVTGCQESAGDQAFSGQFQVVALADAPAPLQAAYDQAKLVPGMAVLKQDGRTYLLLTAGRSEQPGLTIDVLQVQKPAGSGQREVRIVARLMPGADRAEQYPHAVVVLDGTPDYQFRARVATRSETVLELTGLPVQ
jgi:hypothetical protein